MLVWSTDSKGGFLTSPELSDIVRYRGQSQQVFTNFVTAVGSETEFGMNRGDEAQWVSVSDLEDGRIVSESELVPTGSINIERQSVRALEITLGIDYNWRLDILAKLDVYSMLVQSLVNSMARTLDRMCANVFRATDLVYTPTGSLTNPSYTLGTAGLPLATAQRAFTIWDHMNIVDLLSGTYYAPKYSGGNYQVVGSVGFMRSILEDNQWQKANTQFNSNTHIIEGMIGSYYGGNFIQETNALTPNFGADLGEAIYIGGDAVYEICIYPEEIQAKLGADYGRDRGMRWVTYKNWAEVQKYSRGQTPRLLRVAALAS